MPPQSVIIHERQAHWARQLRPRFRSESIRWAETRSADSLARAAGRSICPIILVDLDGRSCRGLADLMTALEVAPNALSLVLDARARPEIELMAHEIGATRVLGDVVVPPQVEAVIRFWLPIAAQRAESEGWAPSAEPEPEIWERPELYAFPNEPNRV